MSQTDKAQLWKELKDRGVEFPLHYREYNTEQLAAMLTEIRTVDGDTNLDNLQEQDVYEYEAPPLQSPSDTAGLNQYSDDYEQPIRTDAQGRIWFRDEVRKPATPLPRKRRALKYVDSGTVRKQVANGQFFETIEVAGEQQREAEVKITMPSWQVGLFKDPRFPFRIHIYNERRGFDLFEVQRYYGGGDMVPRAIKRVYVGNVLCYDITTTVRAIEDEYRTTVLKKG